MLNEKSSAEKPLKGINIYQYYYSNISTGIRKDEYTPNPKPLFTPGSAKRIHFEDESNSTIDSYHNDSIDIPEGWSAEDQSFYKKLGSPAQTPGPPGWKEFIRAPQAPYSPTLVSMTSNNIGDKTPQAGTNYKQPDLNSSYWRSSSPTTPNFNAKNKQ